MNQIFTADTFGELSRQIETFIEDYDVFDYDSVTIVTGKVADDTPAGYHWKATLMPKETASALKDVLVEEHGVVSLFWNKEDVIELARQDNRRELTDSEVDDIARQLANNDCEYGISRQAIRDITLVVCPDAVSMDGYEEEDNGIEYLRHIEKQYTSDEQ